MRRLVIARARIAGRAVLAAVAALGLSLAPACDRAPAPSPPTTSGASGAASVSAAAPAPSSSVSPRPTGEVPATAAGLVVVERVTGGATATDTLPLVIALHGLGDRPERFLDLFSGFSGKARVVALRAPDAHGPGFSWFPTRAEAGAVTVHAEGVAKAAAQVARAADELAKVRPTVGKPIVLGFSQGGMISFALAVHHPAHFAAVHPLAGWLPEALIPQKKDPAAAYPRIVALHGDADERLPIGPTRAGVARLSALGIAVDFREYPGVGHTLSSKMRADLFAELASETRPLPVSADTSARAQGEPSAPEPSLPTHLAWALTLVATFTMSISYVDRQAFAILAPSFTKELGIADDVLSRLLATFSVAYLIGAPLAGRFIDAVGARRGLLGAVLTWSIVAALHALAPGVGVLFGLRIALGLAESPSFPGSAQTVNRALPPADRPRGFGILFTGSSIGAMLVAPLASRLAAAYGWRTAFVLTAVIGLCWVPVWLGLSFHPACRAVLDRRDEVGQAAAPRPGIAELLRHRDVQRAILLVLATAPGIAFVLNLAPTFLAKHHGLDQKAIGNYLWFPPIMFDIGAVLFGDLSARARRRRGGALAPDRGLIALGALLAATLAAMPLCPTPITAVGVAGVALLGGGGVYALLTADMMARVPPAAVASAGGITAAAQSITHIVGLPLVGQAATSLGGYDVPVMVLGAWVIPATLLWLRIRPGALRA